MGKIDPKGFLPGRREKAAVPPVQSGRTFSLGQRHTQAGPGQKKKQPGDQGKIIGGKIVRAGKAQRGGKGVSVQKSRQGDLPGKQAQMSFWHRQAEKKKGQPPSGSPKGRDPV